MNLVESTIYVEKYEYNKMAVDRLVLIREELIHGYGVPNVPQLGQGSNQHRLAFEPLQHFFVDDDEKRELAANNPTIGSSVMYIFLKNPTNLKKTKVFDKIPSFTKKFIAYLIYSSGGKVKMKCAIMDNALELGSKHVFLSSQITEKDAVFLSAGELTFRNENACLFNTFSGTYVVPRLSLTYDSLELENEPDDFSPEVINQAFATINNWKYVHDWLKKLNPRLAFYFVSYELPKDRFRLGSIMDKLGRDDIPYVAPFNETNWHSLAMANNVMTNFKNLRLVKPYRHEVNATAVDLVNDTTSVMTSALVQSFDQYTEPIAVIKNWSIPKSGGFVNILPSKFDLKNAMRVLRAIGAKKFGPGALRNVRSVEVVDYFNLVGRRFLLRVDGEKSKELNVTAFLATSQNTVYKCTLDGVLKVLKVKSIGERFAFDTLNFISTFRAEAAFYKEHVHEFVIPGYAAIGTILPYMGRTVTSIPLQERRRLYKKFKMEYIDEFKKHVKKTMMGQVYSKYNDVKPDNTTLDNDGNFRLIDFDSNAHTPAFYGPDGNTKMQQQLFGVVLVYHWFHTGEKLDDWSDEGKVRWMNDEVDDNDLQDLLTIIYDDDFDDSERLNQFEKHVQKN